jgi:hypothetical protein
MKVLVLSDTHIPVAKESLPPTIVEEAKKSDVCFHAGDFISYEVFKLLSAYTTVYGVSGNMDSSEIISKLPLKRIVTLENIKLGIIHGRGAPSSLLNYIDREFYDNLGDINIFIFGHSHYPYDKEINGKIYFNPGSPTDEVFAPYCSYGILEIEGATIKRRIVKVG